MLKPLIAAVLLIAGTCVHAEPALTAARYAAQLGGGMDVDWARTDRGIREFDPLVVRDFRTAGISHVRIRVAADISEARLIHLRKLVEACEQYGIIPIISYQADAFRSNANSKNEAQLVAWWTSVAQYFVGTHPLLGFDLIYDQGDKLNHDRLLLKRAYDKTIKTIHAIDPQRMIFVAPHVRGMPDELPGLKLPEKSQDYLLAEWHIYPWGPSKNNGKYPWTSGTNAEKSAIRARINAAVHWQQKTGHATWVGGWSVKGTIKGAPGAEQIAFATFVACELQKVKIPYAIHADTLFYDGEEGTWRPGAEPLLQAVTSPNCDSISAKPDHRSPKASANM